MLAAEGGRFDLTLTATPRTGSAKSFVYGATILFAADETGAVHFGGLVLTTGSAATARAGDASATLLYHGARRGLLVMTMVGSVDEVLDSRLGALCESGGRWRLPSVAEAGALLADDSESFAELSGSGPAGWVAGARITLGAVGVGDAGALGGGLRTSDYDDDGARVAAEVSGSDLSTAESGGVACVSSSAGFAELPALATIRIYGGGSRRAEGRVGGGAVLTARAVLVRRGGSGAEEFASGVSVGLSLSAPEGMSLIRLASDSPGVALGAVSVANFAEFLAAGEDGVLPNDFGYTLHAETALGWTLASAGSLGFRYSASLAATLSGEGAAFEFGRFRIPSGGRVAVALPNGDTAFARYHGNYRGAEVVYADGNLSAESARGFCAAAGWRLPHMGEAAGLASARGADLNLTLRADVDAAGVDAAGVAYDIAAAGSGEGFFGSQVWSDDRSLESPGRQLALRGTAEGAVVSAPGSAVAVCVSSEGDAGDYVAGALFESDVARRVFGDG